MDDWATLYPDPFSETKWDEWISPSAVGGIGIQENALELTLSPGLPFHKIYFFAEALLTGGTTQYFAKGSLQLSNGGNIGPKLPASVGNNDVAGKMGKSIPSLWASGQSFVNDSIFVVLSANFAMATATVNPFRCMFRANRIVYNLETLAPGTIQQLRVFLQVVSSNNPY